ncbi:MAG TPA: lytic transglycosylase domain-containing protein [Longimicrobium sp.]|jgi:soluble lytic murein transglycosylase-like protein
MHASTVGAWPTPIALCAVLALCFAAPANAQQEPASPAQAVPEPGFWERLRTEARRFREINARPFTYALRYRISNDLASTIHEAARSEGIDPELAFRLVRVESNFNPRARSYAGAMGLTQLMPGTARSIDRRMGDRSRLLDPDANLRVGFRYLRTLLRHYDGDVRLALLAYNRGEGNVDRDLRRGRNPENGYSGKVLGRGVDRYRGSGLAQR